MRKLLILAFSIWLMDYGFSMNQFSNCSDEQIEQVVNLSEEGINKIDDWQKQIADHKKVSKVQSFNLSIASNVLDCAQREMKDIIYICTNERDDEYLAITIPVIGSKVWLTKNFFDRHDKSVKMGTLIHESTHKCGTNDLTYFLERSPRSVGIMNWAMIASTYSYWSYRGFCVPGFDCPERKTTQNHSRGRR